MDVYHTDIINVKIYLSVNYVEATEWIKFGNLSVWQGTSWLWPKDTFYPTGTGDAADRS